MLYRGLGDKNTAAHAGRWTKSAKDSHELRGKVLGIVGYGHIGSQVSILAEAFGMQVVFHDAEPKLPMGNAQQRATLDEVLSASDIVTLHVAANSETNGMVNDEFLASMKDGAMLINTTRGSLVDEAALIKAMDSKGITAGLDVYNNEPGSGDSTFDAPIAKHPNVVGTHHLGASTDQAQAAIADEAVRIVRVYDDTGEIPNVVNRKAASDAKRILIVRHENRPGVLAHVISKISDAKVNIEEMDNVIYQGDKGAKAKIRLGGPVPESVMAAIADGSAGILSVSLTEID